VLSLHIHTGPGIWKSRNHHWRRKPKLFIPVLYTVGIIVSGVFILDNGWMEGNRDRDRDRDREGFAILAQAEIRTAYVHYTKYNH
jgi:hypothetical protein